MGTKVEAPPPRDYGRETRDTLEAQIDLAPDLYEAEASDEYGQPAYTELGLKTLGRALFGSADNKGLLDIYSQDINPRMSAMERESDRARRMGDLADVEAYGGRATEALLGSDPYKKQLSDELSQQALAELQTGATLDPSLRREVQQAYRSGATARGLAYNPSSASEEAYFTGLKAEQLRRQRQAFASQALAQRQGLTGDPFMQILGRPGQAFAASQGFGQQGMMMGQTAPRLFSPESAYAGDLFAGNQAAQMAANTASAQNKSAIIGGAMGMLGSIGGGYAKGLGQSACHVAREVYGEDNPKWVEFFVWKESEGPRWFKALYNEYSESWAAFIRNKPTLKAIIRKWMDTKIKGE